MNLRSRLLVAAVTLPLCVALAACGADVGAVDVPTTAPPPGPTAALDQPGAVLLIPGYGGGGRFLDAAANPLRARGLTVVEVDIDDGTGDLREYADRVVREAKTLIAAGAPSVDIVGFSAGGVIARIAATSPTGQPLVRKVVTVGSPHDGTALSAIGRTFRQCPTACEQLAPNSMLLSQLPPASSADRYLSIWSRTDDVVRPPESAELDGASELAVQDVCDRPVGHIALMSDPLTEAAIGSYLDGRALPTVCP